MVKRSIDQKLRAQNFDARPGGIETGAMVKNRKGLSGVQKRRRYLVPAERKKASVRKETVAYSAAIPKIVRKNQNPKPPRLLSHQCREVEVCRGKEVSEAKVTMVPLFDNRADNI